MNFRLGLSILFLVLVSAQHALAVPVQLPGILVTDDIADPFDYGDSRGVVVGIRYGGLDRPIITIATAPDGLVKPVSAALLPDRRLYVLDRASDPFGFGTATGAVYLVDPSDRPAEAEGIPVMASPLFRRPTDLLLDESLRILVLDSDADPFVRGGGPGALFRGDPETNNFEVLAADTRFKEPVCLAQDVDGTLLVLDRFANPGGHSDPTPGALFRVDPFTGEVTLVKAFDPAELPDPRAVAVRPDGNYLIVDSVADPTGQSDTRGAVFLLTRSTNELSVYVDDPLFRDPTDILVGDSNDVWVLDRTADTDGAPSSVGTIFRFDLTTGERSLAQSSTLFKGPVGIAFAGGPSLDGSSTEWIDETEGELEPGNFVTVRTTLQSAGTEDAIGAVVTDTLSTDWVFVAGSDSLGRGAFDYDPETSILTWNLDIPKGTSETLRYRLRVNGALEHGDAVSDDVYYKLDTFSIHTGYEDFVAVAFSPGVVVFVDQRVQDGEQVGLIREVVPGSLTPRTVHIGAPLVQPVDAEFLEDGRLAILDLAAAPQQGTGSQAVLAYDRARDRFDILWSREQGDGVVAPTGIALDANGDILLVDRNANPFDLPYTPGPGDTGPGAVFRIDIETGAFAPVFSDERMREPYSADVARDGTIVVVDYQGTNGNGDLWEYSPVTEAVTRRALIDSWFRDPIGVSVDPETNAAYVTDFTHFNDENEDPFVNNGTLLLVNRGSNTTYAILSQSPRLVDPADCYLSSDRVLYLTDREANPRNLDESDPGAVFAYDLTTNLFTTVVADYGVHRPAGPTGIGEGRLEVGDLVVVDQDGGAVSEGDTLLVSLELVNTGKQQLPEVLCKFELSAALDLGAASANFGEVLRSDLDLFSWVGTIGAGDTLRIESEFYANAGTGYGDEVVATATAYASDQVEERRFETVLAAPFVPGTILVSDESADPNDLGGGLGAVFRLGRNQEPASILEAGPPFVDPSSILFRSDGHLIIADRQAANPGEVFELDPNRGTLESMLTDNSALPTPVDLVETPDGDLLIVDRSADFNGNTAGEGGLFLLERGATVPTLLSGDPEFRFLSEATYLADGRLFVTDRSANPGQVSSASIFEINPSTGAIENTWQFPQLVEPTGLTTYQDTLLLITDLVANPRNFSTTTGTLFTLDPDEGTLSEFLAIARLVRPYRSYPQQDGSVLILDQAASPNGLPDQTGIIFRYDPAARVLRDFAWTDGLVFPSEVAQLPASAIQFSAYGVEDTDGAPLRASDRVAIQAEIRNDGSIPAVAEFEDTLPDGVVAVPGSVEATVGTAVIVGNTITWTGELSPAQSAQISYEAQLDPPRVKDRILEFAPLARGPIVGELSRTAHLAVFVGFDPGYFYVVDEDADPLLTGRGRGAILKVQQRTGTTVSLFADLDWVVPIDLAILGDSNPKLYLLDVAQQPPNGRRGAVFEVDPSDLSSRLAAADVSWLRTESIVPFEEDGLLVVDSWADPFLLDDPVGPGAVYYVEPTSGQVLPLVSDTTWVRPIDIAQTKTGRWLLLDADADPLGTGVNRGAIWELDLAEGTSTLFAASPEWVEPVAITVAGDSTIYVVDQRATPSGNGIGSIWTVPDTPGSTPVLYAVSDEFRRPHDLVVQIDGDLVLVDGEAAPAAQETGRGAIFVSQGQGFAPLAAVELMREPRSILVFGDVTPIVDLHLYARPLDLGVEVGWTGLAGASGVDYLIYRRIVEGPDVDLSGEPNLEDYELVPTEVTFRGTGEHVFVDRTVEPDTWYAYVIASVRNSGGYDTSYPVTARSGSLAFALGNGEPNPFGGQTTLRFQIPRTGQVDLEIFDVGGRRVRRLVSEPLEAGRHQVVWDGRSDRSHPLASGVYFVRLAWDGKVLTNRMVRLK